jgi:hypothetical protein
MQSAHEPQSVSCDNDALDGYQSGYHNITKQMFTNCVKADIIENSAEDKFRSNGTYLAVLDVSGKIKDSSVILLVSGE